MDPTSVIVSAVVTLILTVLAHRNGIVDLGGQGTPAVPPVTVPVNPAHPVLSLLEQELLNVVRGVVSGLVLNAQAGHAAPAAPPTPPAAPKA